MCSFYLDLYTPGWFAQVVSGAVFPWCAVRARGSFRQPQLANIHSARRAARGRTLGGVGARFVRCPGLEAGERANTPLDDFFARRLQTLRLSEIQGRALKTGRKERNQGRPEGRLTLMGLTYEYLARRLR